jgi:hypothetical protein
MRSFSLVSICALMLAAAACGDSPSDGSGGEINSQEDVRNLFQAVMPDLVAALTELANEGAAAPALKSAHSSTVQCPGGGTLTANLATGQATLTDCTAGGVTISATLVLAVVSAGPPSYEATFAGTLMVSGSYTGTVEVLSALIQWTDPATDANTYWEVMVLINGQTFTVTSGDSGGSGLECPAVNGGGSVERDGPCDDNSDCLSNSCREPERDPSERCTCRPLDGGGGGDGDCSSCLGVNSAPPSAPPDPATSCGDEIDFSCTCQTESGATATFYLSAGECIF